MPGNVDLERTQDDLDATQSTDVGESWGPPLEVTADDTNGLDKQSITADPYASNRVYAVWDRFLSPPGINANDQARSTPARRWSRPGSRGRRTSVRRGSPHGSPSTPGRTQARSATSS